VLPAIRALVECEVPVISAVRGRAIGGGAEIVQMSDLAVATCRLPEARIGVRPAVFAADVVLAERFPVDQVGVLVDACHVWWDPGLFGEPALFGERIAGFQVCDWTVPLPEGVLTGRGMTGDGCVDLRGLRQAVEVGGYRGLTEVEIFNAALWQRPGKDPSPFRTGSRVIDHSLVLTLG
jgi:enoyl-CoA hydratase/carnithine racemase